MCEKEIVPHQPEASLLVTVCYIGYNYKYKIGEKCIIKQLHEHILGLRSVLASAPQGRAEGAIAPSAQSFALPPQMISVKRHFSQNFMHFLSKIVVLPPRKV